MELQHEERRNVSRPWQQGILQRRPQEARAHGQHAERSGPAEHARGSHYEGAEAAETIAAGTQLSKVYGPFFYYNNSVPAGTANAGTVLFATPLPRPRPSRRRGLTRGS